jgi:hypothetical protein
MKPLLVSLSKKMGSLRTYDNNILVILCRSTINILMLSTVLLEGFQEQWSEWSAKSW